MVPDFRRAAEGFQKQVQNRVWLVNPKFVLLLILISVLNAEISIMICCIKGLCQYQEVTRVKNADNHTVFRRLNIPCLR